MQLNPINQITKEQENWILWLPVIFGLGVVFHFSFSHSDSLFALLVFAAALFVSIWIKDELKSLIANAILIFMCGFLWSGFYEHHFIKAPVVNSKIFGEVIGKVHEIKEYDDGKRRIVIGDLEIFSSKFEGTVKARKAKKEVTLKNKPVRISKNIKKTYLNLNGFVELDRDLEALKNKYGYNNFVNDKYQNPPKRISLLLRNKNEKVAIGDVIRSKIMLQPFSGGEDEISSFDFVRHNYFNQIGGSGFVTSNFKVISKSLNTKNKIDIWRYGVANKIQEDFGVENGSILIALLLGIRDFIAPDLMDDIRKSGLAHLLSISGLHLSLAGLMFFGIFRFLLSRSQFLALRFDLKKVSAVLAIFSSLIYLIIAGSPIPALRAFFMIAVIFLSFIFGRKINPLRSLALAALLVLIINPTSLFAISFQMSFVAILALITFYNLTKDYLQFNNQDGILLKIRNYFLAIALSSLVAQIALTPFTIYYFNNASILGVFTNLIAVPLTALIIMPLAFLYLILLNFNLEFLTFYPLNFAIEMVIDSASMVADLKYSNINVSFISKASMGVMIFGFLWLSLWEQKWRYFGIVAIFIGAILALKTPLPNLIVDGNRQFFAIYDNKKGLFFSKKLRQSFRVKNLMKKLAQDEFKTIEELANEDIFCEYEHCKALVDNKRILVLTKRNEVDFICQNNFDILVNLSKYQHPPCLDRSKIIVNNIDLELFGAKYLYLR